MAVLAKFPVSPEAPLLGKTPSGRREMSRKRQRVDDWRAVGETERLYEGNLKMKIGEPETLRLSYISVSNTFEI